MKIETCEVNDPHRIQTFTVDLASATPGGRITVDRNGRDWISEGDEIMCIHSDGSHYQRGVVSRFTDEDKIVITLRV